MLKKKTLINLHNTLTFTTVKVKDEAHCVENIARDSLPEDFLSTLLIDFSFFWGGGVLFF